MGKATEKLGQGDRKAWAKPSNALWGDIGYVKMKTFAELRELVPVKGKGLKASSSSTFASRRTAGLYFKQLAAQGDRDGFGTIRGAELVVHLVQMLLDAAF